MVIWETIQPKVRLNEKLAGAGLITANYLTHFSNFGLTSFAVNNFSNPSGFCISIAFSSRKLTPFIRSNPISVAIVILVLYLSPSLSVPLIGLFAVLMRVPLRLTKARGRIASFDRQSHQ